MELFKELMKNDQIKRSVLIHFGFGNVNKSKVEKWVEKTYPEFFYEIKKNMRFTNLVEFAPREIEILTANERSALLDLVCLEKGGDLQPFKGDLKVKTAEQLTIQFKTTEMEGNILHHMVFEAEIRSVEDLFALSLTKGRYTKFKRTTDKRWYTFRTFAKRLFERQMFDKVFNEFNINDPIEEYETNFR